MKNKKQIVGMILLAFFSSYIESSELIRKALKDPEIALYAACQEYKNEKEINEMWKSAHREDGFVDSKVYSSIQNHRDIKQLLLEKTIVTLYQKKLKTSEAVISSQQEFKENEKKDINYCSRFLQFIGF